MIRYFALYDAWAKEARKRGFTEWPEPGTKDVWTGVSGIQFGYWSGADNSGILCTTSEEFNIWVETPPFIG